MNTPLLFHPMSVSDTALDYLRHLIVMKGFDASAPLAEWILGWIAEEQKARREKSTERRKQHVIALPPCPDWSDSQVAGALVMSNTLSYVPGIPAELSPFVDRLAHCMVGVAVERLEHKQPEADMS